MSPEADADLRATAVSLAAHDFADAERIADRIECDHDRAIALAWVLRYSAEPEFDRVVRKSFEAAADCQLAREQADAGAWVARALLDRDRTELALTMFEMAVAAVVRIPLAEQRSEMLLLLLHAGVSISSEFRQSILFALAEMYDGPDTKRVQAHFFEALLIAKALEPEFVRKLACGQDLAEEDAFRQLLAAPDKEPRVFFV